MLSKIFEWICAYIAFTLVSLIFIGIIAFGIILMVSAIGGT